MKVDIFRMTSIDPYGVGNKENGLLDLLYSYFLNKYGLDYYPYLVVNQIHQEQGIEEFVDIQKNEAFVSIVFNTAPSFETLDDLHKNKIRLDLIHAGLLRLSEKDERFSKSILEKIKREILDSNFTFDLPGEIRKNPKDESTIFRFVLRPHTKYFDHFFLIQRDGKDLCKMHVYRGKPYTSYFESFFSKVTWKPNNRIVIEGKEKQMKITFDFEKCKILFENLTQYPKPPLWEMSRADISEKENLTAYENWIHSLPPGYAAIIRNSEN